MEEFKCCGGVPTLAISDAGSCIQQIQAFIQYISNNKAPTVGLEPTTTRLRALRSAD